MPRPSKTSAKALPSPSTGPLGREPAGGDYRAPAHVRKRAWERHQRLTELGYANYEAYLHSPHWMDTRRRYYESDRPQECICGAAEDLQLHHLTYERVGRERLEDLLPFCKGCHRLIHILERRREIGLDLDGLESTERAARYAIEQAPRRTRARKEVQAVPSDPTLDTLLREIDMRLTLLQAHAGNNRIDARSSVRLIRMKLNEIERKVRRARPVGLHAARGPVPPADK